MNKIIITGAVISRGYGTQPAIHFSENGNCARFKIGQRVYDKRAENSTRWLNLHVKAFGTLAERISKMGLKEASCVNIVGRLDEDTWEDKESGETKRQFIIVLDEIEYAFTGERKAVPGGDSAEGDEPRGVAATTEGSQGCFTGYENFGPNELY